MSGAGRLRSRYAARIPSNEPVTPAAARFIALPCTKVTVSGQLLARAAFSISTDASTAMISASGATSSSAAVDAPVPQPRSSRRRPRPPSGRPMRWAESRRWSW